MWGTGQGEEEQDRGEWKKGKEKREMINDGGGKDGQGGF